MLNLKIKSIERNRKGNFHIIGDSQLFNNTKNKIGIVEIDIPNGILCKNKEIVALASSKKE